MAVNQSRTMSLLRKMNLGRRFVVLGMLALALVGFQLSLYVREANKLIESTATERSGLPVVEALMEAVRVTQLHRGVAHAWLAGVGTTPAQFEAARTDAAKTMPLLEKLAADDAVPQDLRKPLVAAVSEWKNLSTAVVAKSIEVADSRKRQGGTVLEQVGTFNPIARGKEVQLRLDLARIEHWASQGARPSDRVSALVVQYKKQAA